MTRSYPLVQEADQEVATAKAAIAAAEKTQYVTQTTDRDPTFELLREDSAKTEADLAAQRANLTAIKSSIQSLQTQMVDLDQKALTQQDLLRSVRRTKITICSISRSESRSGHPTRSTKRELRMSQLRFLRTSPHCQHMAFRS